MGTKTRPNLFNPCPHVPDEVPMSELPPSAPKLTARQQQILELIQTAISRSGAPPTRAEIASELGWKSVV